MGNSDHGTIHMETQMRSALMSGRETEREILAVAFQVEVPETL